MTLVEVGKWVAVAQLAMGIVCLVTGLRNRDRSGDLLAPMGAMFVVFALFKLTRRTVPLEILIPLTLLAFTVLTVWYVRAFRAARARTRELLKQRAQSQS